MDYISYPGLNICVPVSLPISFTCIVYPLKGIATSFCIPTNRKWCLLDLIKGLSILPHTFQNLHINSNIVLEGERDWQSPSRGV